VRRGEGKEGIANLIEIAAVATGRTAEEVEAAYVGAGYGQFKTEVADAVVEYLRPVRGRYLELRSDPAHLQAVLGAGAQRAETVAAETIDLIKRRMGFVPRAAG
jgi:tryptophanyl-tRNA synthetase